MKRFDAELDCILNNKSELDVWHAAVPSGNKTS